MNGSPASTALGGPRPIERLDCSCLAGMVNASREARGESPTVLSSALPPRHSRKYELRHPRSGAGQGGPRSLDPPGLRRDHHRFQIQGPRISQPARGGAEEPPDPS